MTRQVHEFAQPDRAVIGTVGEPGERTFFLQAREGNRIVSVVLEKTQAEILADRIDELLDEVRRTRPDAGEIPDADALPADLDPLDVPIIEEFRVGAMALGWDDGGHRLVVEAHATSEEPTDVPDIAEDSAEGQDTMRIWLTARQARAFATRARAVVAAGRRACPFCSQPLDPQGHICPRANGYRRQG